MSAPKTVTIQKSKLEDKAVSDLIQLLESIMTDGGLSEGEVVLLAEFLSKHPDKTDVPAFFFLREIVDEIRGDGRLEPHELDMLHGAILRVLPKEKRDRAKEARAAAVSAKRKELAMSRDQATDRQIDYIRNLGGVIEPGMTKKEASKKIESLLENRPTARQMMVLRFWDRLDLNQEGVAGVSRWMDEWYSEDPLRIKAWNLWKNENNDTGGRSQDDVESVPLGIGDDYLRRVSKKNQKPLGCANLAICVIAIFVIVWLLRRC